MYPTVNDVANAMRTLGSRLMQIATALMVVTALILGGAPTAAALNDAQQIVVDSWRLVNQGYFDPDHLESIRWKRQRQKALEKTINTSEEAYQAVDVMLASIGEPYTRLLRPRDYAALKDSTSGSLSGVGLQLGPGSSSDAVVIISALEGSPAADAGLVPGTEVTAVDGMPVRDMGLGATANSLRGDVGTQVVLQVQGKDGETSEVTLERRNVDLRPVRTKRVRSATHTLGYLRITQFSEDVPQQVMEALEELKIKNVEGLILDLRNNSGGLVSAGLAVADDFLKGDAIVETRDRNGISDTVQARPTRLYDGPMLTLVNAGTASASEILAGALQDSGRSLLMGQQTFGKGLIQTLTNLSDGSGLAVTVAGYVTPSGRDIQGEGIAPDQVLETPEPLNPGSEGDLWLSSAENWMESHLAMDNQSSGHDIPA
ncbi:MAG: carboxyl-terminal processing protease CtpZ [Synechococcus sp.]